jgi:hypothetical protein
VPDNPAGTTKVTWYKPIVAGASPAKFMTAGSPPTVTVTVAFANAGEGELGAGAPSATTGVVAPSPSTYAEIASPARAGFAAETVCEAELMKLPIPVPVPADVNIPGAYATTESVTAAESTPLLLTATVAVLPVSPNGAWKFTWLAETNSTGTGTPLIWTAVLLHVVGALPPVVQFSEEALRLLPKTAMASPGASPVAKIDAPLTTVLIAGPGATTVASVVFAVAEPAPETLIAFDSGVVAVLDTFTVTVIAA